MAELKRRLDRIARRIGGDSPQPPRTIADFVRWETEHRTANGGELTPAETAWIRTAWRGFIAQARERRV